MSDFGRIRDNVQKMVDQQASVEDITGYLGTEGFTAPEFKLANENYGTFMSAVKRSGKNIGSLIGDFLPAMGADLLEKIAPESFKPEIQAYKEKQLKEEGFNPEQAARWKDILNKAEKDPIRSTSQSLLHTMNPSDRFAFEEYMKKVSTEVEKEVLSKYLLKVEPKEIDEK